MKKIAYIFVSALLLASCSDFLQRNPIAQIGSEDYFINETSLKTYLNGFINSYTPNHSAVAEEELAGDVLVSVLSWVDYLASDWSPDVESGWSSSDWNPIYNINYFLKHFREVPGLTEETYNHYEATARFWRAFKYFNFVKKFGAVPFYTEPIDASDTEALYKPRDNREQVMEWILEDLDFACKNLSTSSEWVDNANINRYIALAFKSRVCLYEGTYRKYHKTDPSTGLAWKKDEATKYLTEAASAAKELMDIGKYKLTNSAANVKTQYRALFTSEAVDHGEVIWANEYNAALSRTHFLTWRFASGSYGGRVSADQDLIRLYLNLDGTSHTMVQGEQFVDEVKNRDYRLAQTWITPGYTKKIGGVTQLFAPYFGCTLTGYQPIKWNLDDDTYEGAAIAPNSIPIIRYAEVLLNYAEAKAELGQFGDAEWNLTIKPLRERAGVVGTRFKTSDPYLKQYYGFDNPDLLEIRRERTIELILESFRYDDLCRWGCWEKLNKQWYGIYIPEMGKAYDLNEDGINDVCVVASAKEAGSEKGVTYIIADGKTFSLENGTSGRLMYNIDRQFSEKRYVHPIPRSALVVNPKLEQNASWK